MEITRAFLSVSLLLFSSPLVAGPTPTDESAAEMKITTTLHQMYEAENRRDLNFVLAHLANDFAEVAGDGKIYHRSDIQAGWADVSLENYELSDCVFKLMTSDAAYLSCAMKVEATYKAQPLPQHFRVTTVWTSHDGGWLIRFEQATIVPDAKEAGTKK